MKSDESLMLVLSSQLKKQMSFLLLAHLIQHLGPKWGSLSPFHLTLADPSPAGHSL